MLGEGYSKGTVIDPDGAIALEEAVAHANNVINHWLEHCGDAEAIRKYMDAESVVALCTPDQELRLVTLADGVVYLHDGKPATWFDTALPDLFYLGDETKAALPGLLLECCRQSVWR